MNAYITSIKLCGIKNIDHEITLNFYKQTIPKEFTLDQSNMKAIYGENGAGKSGIIHAMYIYQRICLEKNYLQNPYTIKLLSELINKKTKKLSIQVTFFILDETEIMCKHQHEIQIARGEDGYFHVLYESIADVSKRKEKCLLEIVNGEIQNTSTIFDEALIENTKNLLRDQSIISIWYQNALANRTVEKYDKETGIVLSSIVIMVSSILIFTSNRDTYDEYTTDSTLFSDFPFGEIQDSTELQYYKFTEFKSYHMISYRSDILNKKELPIYEDKIKRLTMFMKLLKNDLLDIEIEKKERIDLFVCDKYFVYDGYRINVEFESAGIKKLINLFEALEAFVNGRIVFIDELDANIHDVILLKLLEYFCEYAKGQLCFTTHNLGPMEILRKRKYAIDFLSQDSQITSWKKNGHYSVINLYREGMIEHHPFNIEPIDFAGIFESGEE